VGSSVSAHGSIDQISAMIKMGIFPAGHPLATNRVLHLGQFALSSYSRKKIKNFYTGFCEQIGARVNIFSLSFAVYGSIIF